MGKSSHKRRAQAKRQIVDPDTLGSDSQQHTPETIGRMIAGASYAAVGHGADTALFNQFIRRLTQIELSVASDMRPTALLALDIQRRISALYEQGWQPADIAHAIKRQFTVRAWRLVIAFIAADARATDAVNRAPAAWLNQLEELHVVNVARDAIIGGRDQPLAVWARVEKLDPDEIISVAIQVNAQLLRLPVVSVLVTPPSAWGASNKGLPPTTPRASSSAPPSASAASSASASAADIDTKALKLIRALLAKAEATTFPAEADSFTAKAQQMMTRYSIDAAVLASGAAGDKRASGIEQRRVHIDNPYADEKADFIAVLAHVNGARCVWSPSLGFATIIGFPVDLHLTDLLFTSLLLQATRASAEATANDRDLRTASFRRAFLIAFADRIGERLEATKKSAAAEAEQEYGSALLPILAGRQVAVADAFAEAFPNVTFTQSRSLNAHGWHAGRAAGDRATIGTGEAITSG